MCTQLHFNIRKETEVQMDKKHWYEHVPKSVETSQGSKVNILWNQSTKWQNYPRQRDDDDDDDDDNNNNNNNSATIFWTLS